MAQSLPDEYIEPPYDLTPKTNDPQTPPGYKEPEYNLKIKTPPTLQEDVGKGVVSGLGKGVAAIPGMIGGMGQLYDRATAYPSTVLAHAAEAMGLLPKGKTAEDLLKSINQIGEPTQSEPESGGKTNSIFGVPFVTPDGMVQLTEKAGVPFYHPQTTPGRVAEGLASAVPGLALTPGTAYQRIASTFLPALGSTSAHELIGEADLPWWMPDPGLVGATAGMATAGAGNALMTSRSQAASVARAKLIAGQVLRESLTEPDAAITKLAPYATQTVPGLPPRGPSLIPGAPGEAGVNPTTAQALRSGEMQDLQRRMTQSGVADSSPEVQALRGQVEGSQNALTHGAGVVATAVEGNIPKVDMPKAIGLSGNAQGEASIAARGEIKKVEVSMANAENAAWEKLRDTGATVNKTKILPQLQDFINNLDPVYLSTFPNFITNALKNIAKNSSEEISIQTIQNLRSLTLKAARGQHASNTPIMAAPLNDFATKIATILQDSDNFTFAGGKAPAAWNEARAATAKYQKTFGDNLAGDLTEQTLSGVPTVSGELTLNRILGHPDSAENLRQIRKIPGVNIDNHAADWMVGKLTKNGDNVNITPDQVKSFIADPKNAAIIQQIPGLEVRLKSIAQQAGESQFAYQTRSTLDAFSNVMQKNDPKALSSFLDTYGDNLKLALPNAADRAFIDNLNHSAKTISSIPATGVAGTKTLDHLANGRMMDILYGRAIGAISDSVVGALAGHLVGLGTGQSWLLAAGATANLLKIPGRASGILGDAMNNVLFGSTKEEAIRLLQQAVKDPRLAKILLEKPSPDALNSLSQIAKRSMESTFTTSLRTGAARYAAPISQGEPSERETRATGGRVGSDHERLVGRLMTLAERAKKEVNTSTEPLLNVPDAAIVKALHVANQAI